MSNMRNLQIDKERFVKIINKLKEHDEYIDKLYDIFGVDFEKVPYIDDMFIHLLDDLTNDEEWIAYFCYELNFGKRYEDGMVTVDNKSVDISTPEKLYDMLKADYDKKYEKENPCNICKTFHGWNVQMP